MPNTKREDHVSGADPILNFMFYLLLRGGQNQESRILAGSTNMGRLPRASQAAADIMDGNEHSELA
jgi:hypothetical protein